MVDLTGNEEGTRLLKLFADILDYPGPGLLEQVREGRPLLAAMDREAANRLERFLDLAGESSQAGLEETYVATFELQAACHPYAGYHLFGESYKRNLFLVKLKEKFQEQGFSAGQELPDYLPVLLRFLPMAGSAEEKLVLVRECLAPVLEKMLQSFREEGNPYGEALQALLLALRGPAPAGSASPYELVAKEA